MFLFNDPATTESYTDWRHSFPTRRSSDLRPEQSIDGKDRGQLHRDQSSLTTDTSTIGFLPVHAVAVRRAASRRASRSLASPALASESAAAFTFMRTSSKNDSRSSSTGTPCIITTGSAIGRAHVCTPVTNPLLVCRPMHEQKKIHNSTSVITYTLNR